MILWYKRPWWACAYVESFTDLIPSGWVRVENDEYLFYPEPWLKANRPEYPKVSVKRSWEAEDVFKVHYEPEPANNTIVLPDAWVDPEELVYADILRQVDFSRMKEGATHFLIERHFIVRRPRCESYWTWDIYWAVPNENGYTEYWRLFNYENERVFLNKERVSEMRSFPVEDYGVDGLRLGKSTEQLQERINAMHKQINKLLKTEQ